MFSILHSNLPEKKSANTEYERKRRPYVKRSNKKQERKEEDYYYCHNFVCVLDGFCFLVVFLFRSSFTRAGIPFWQSVSLYSIWVVDSRFVASLLLFRIGFYRRFVPFDVLNEWLTLWYVCTSTGQRNATKHHSMQDRAHAYSQTALHISIESASTISICHMGFESRIDAERECDNWSSFTNIESVNVTQLKWTVVQSTHLTQSTTFSIITRYFNLRSLLVQKKLNFLWCDDDFSENYSWILYWAVFHRVKLHIYRRFTVKSKKIA